MSSRALIVNLFGGPGTGKSTTAALVFGRLKEAGVETELVTEFAKDLVWEGRESTLKCQPYIFGKQLWRIQRVANQVDVIITDSPLLLSLVYGDALGDNWKNFVREQSGYVDGRPGRLNNLDIFLVRNDKIHPFVSAGRYQNTVEEAEKVDASVLAMLERENVEYDTVMIGNNATRDVLDLIRPLGLLPHIDH